VAVLSDVEDDSLALTAEEELKMKNTYILATTALLKKQKEMKDIERLLASKRVEFAARSQELQSRREELEAKQRQLKDRVIKFERFLKENDAKRERANQRVIAEQKQRGLRVQEIESLQEQLRREELMLARTVQTLRKQARRCIIWAISACKFNTRSTHRNVQGVRELPAVCCRHSAAGLSADNRARSLGRADAVPDS
jgi:septal ring factor EnvC (AmiA/AmiB activator)